MTQCYSWYITFDETKHRTFHQNISWKPFLNLYLASLSPGTKPYYSITQVPLLSQYKRPSELDTQAKLAFPLPLTLSVLHIISRYGSQQFTIYNHHFLFMSYISAEIGLTYARNCHFQNFVHFLKSLRPSFCKQTIWGQLMKQHYHGSTKLCPPILPYDMDQYEGPVGPKAGHWTTCS